MTDEPHEDRGERPSADGRSTRRRYLAALTAGSVATLAGCQGLPTEETTGTAPTPTPTPPVGTPTAETPSPTPQAGVILVPDGNLRSLRRRVEGGEEPWHTAFQMLRSDADEALGATPRSVVDNGAPQGAGDPHKFGTDAPYQGEDGVFSDEVNRGDYFAALHMGEWIRNLAMAYGFTGEDRYAEKAVDLLHHWFVAPETRMHPSARNHGPHTKGFIGQNAIEHYITIPKMIYGANYVRDHPHWSTKPDDPRADMNRWVRQYLADSESGGHRGGPEGNGIYKWWLVNRAVAAAYLDDTAALTRCFDDWRTTAFRDFQPRGTFDFALARTRSLFYSLSALDALLLTAEVARHRGVDLYGHQVDGVNRLMKALEYHDRFLQTPDEWQWEELGGLTEGEQEVGGVVYELAYSVYGDDRFERAIDAVGRPIYDQRLLGWSTLTHANLFELDA